MEYHLSFAYFIHFGTSIGNVAQPLSQIVSIYQPIAFIIVFISALFVLAARVVPDTRFGKPFLSYHPNIIPIATGEHQTSQEIPL